jgi:hypothetical protein
VLELADNDKSGGIAVDELKDVIRIWYVVCQEKYEQETKSVSRWPGCCVM